MKIKLLDSFVNKLNDQVRYIASDKPGAARKFKNDLFSKIKNISKMPYKHRKSIYFEDNEIRDLVFKGYKIVYKIEKEHNAIIVFGFIKEEEKLR